MTISHTARGGLSSHNPATCGGLSASSPPFFHSAWGRIGDAMRAAIYRNSGFVLDPRTPSARTGANRKTPGATHSRMSGRPSGTECLRLIKAPPVIPNVPGANSIACVIGGPSPA